MQWQHPLDQPHPQSSFYVQLNQVSCHFLFPLCCLKAPLFHPSRDHPSIAPTKSSFQSPGAGRQSSLLLLLSMFLLLLLLLLLCC
jgi:hypothetical protein